MAKVDLRCTPEHVVGVDMQVVLLCAGMGTRLGDLTDGIPKALVQLNGRPIVSYIWNSLQTPLVDEIIVVGGFGFEKLSACIAGLEGRRVRLVRNDDYMDGSILTVEKALPHVRGGFLLLNGDHIHPREMIELFLDRAQGIACACDSDRVLTDDDMKIKLTAEGRVGLMDKKLSDFECGYIGMTFCAKDTVELYRKYAALTRQRSGDAANVEKIIHTLALDGRNPAVCDVSGYGWIEVDTREDLERAERLVATNQYLSVL